MKRFIIFVLFSIFLSYPISSGAAGDNASQGGLFPLLQFPVGEGATPKSGASLEEGKEEGKKTKEEAQKKMDKKVDDAIKDAWEEK
jgi:hypothetical protein